MDLLNHFPMDLVSQVSYFILLILCAIAAVKDIKTRKIPNQIPVSILIVWILAAVVRYILISGEFLSNEVKIQILKNVRYEEVLPYVLQGLVSAVSVLFLLTASVWIVNKLRQILNRKKQTVLGAGDIKLLTVISLYFGYVGSFICIFIACALFILYFIIVTIAGRKNDKGYAFAPFIFIGVLTAVTFAYMIVYYL